MSPKKKQISWRRIKVQDLLIKGLNQSQIAHMLKVSDFTISGDVNHLRKEAKEKMKVHLEDRLPIEYQYCMAGINQVLKMAWELAGGLNVNENESNHNNGATVEHAKTRLQALALANDCYKYKMDLVTNGMVITDAIKFVQDKKELIAKINTDNGQLDLSGPYTIRSDIVKSESDRTTNQIF